VRVQASDPWQGKRGVGIMIEHYDALKGLEAARLLSAAPLSQS
jgi:hypothetical protein